jgi:hypothetical protein
MASQVYFQGNLWDCVETTSPGETPATAPAKWRKVEIPRDCLRFVPQGALALLMESDGQTDKRGAAERRAQALLDEAMVAMSRNRAHPQLMKVVSR